MFVPLFVVDDIKYNRSVNFVKAKHDRYVNFFIMTDYSLKIKQIRKALELTQQYFAKKIGVAPGTVNRYEKKKSEPDKNILERLVKIFGVNINWYLANQGEMFINSTRAHVPDISEDLKKYLDHVCTEKCIELENKILQKLLKADSKEEKAAG